VPRLLTVTILVAVDGAELTDEEKEPTRIFIENSPGFYTAVMDLAGNLHVYAQGPYLAAVRAAVHEDVCSLPGIPVGAPNAHN
jgi:hypothetical protein